MRVGVHTGAAMERTRDWFGQAVNAAAGLVTTACEGEVLVSEATRAAAMPMEGIELRRAGRPKFKVGAEPIEVYSAMTRPDANGAQRVGADADAECPQARPCPTQC